MSFLEYRLPLYQAIISFARESDNPIYVAPIEINRHDEFDPLKIRCDGGIFSMESEFYDEDEYTEDELIRIFHRIETDHYTIVDFSPDRERYHADWDVLVETFVRPYVNELRKINGIWVCPNEIVNTLTNLNPIVIPRDLDRRN